MAQNGVSTEDQDPTGRSSRLMSRDGPTGEGVAQYSAIRRDASSGARFALTKFRVPMLPGTLVTRSVLNDRLASGIDKRLTLVAGRRGQALSIAGTYERQTVLFALVLLLIAAGQRFTQRPVRISANALQVCLLIYTLGYLTPSCRRSAAIFASSLLVPDPIDAELAGGIEHSST
jgi:hypothetical protein